MSEKPCNQAGIVGTSPCDHPVVRNRFFRRRIHRGLQRLPRGVTVQFQRRQWIVAQLLRMGTDHVSLAVVLARVFLRTEEARIGFQLMVEESDVRPDLRIAFELLAAYGAVVQLLNTVGEHVRLERG